MAFAFFDFWFVLSAPGSDDAGRRRASRVRTVGEREDVRSAAAVLPDEDAALVARVRTGDVAAFETIFRRHGERLIRFAEQELHSADAAEDVVQDVFLAVWRAREAWVVQTSIATYLFQAVRHRVVNRARQRAGEDPRRGGVALTPEMHAADEPAPDDALELDELQMTVERAVVALSPRTREVFQLSRDRGLAYREIAALLGVSVKTVEMHVGRALAALRVALAPWRE